jgi:hypothetical protein
MVLSSSIGDATLLVGALPAAIYEVAPGTGHPPHLTSSRA